MSKRQKGDVGDSGDDVSELVPPLSPPQHDLDVQDVGLSGLSGFNPIPDPLPVCDEPTAAFVDPLYQRVQLSPPLDMEHDAPVFPAFEDLPDCGAGLEPCTSNKIVQTGGLATVSLAETTVQASEPISSSFSMDFDDNELIPLVDPTVVTQEEALPTEDFVHDVTVEDSTVPVLYDEPLDIPQTGYADVIFHDARDDFSEEVDPSVHYVQSDEQSDFSSLFYETDQFQDASDADRLAHSDISYPPEGDAPLYKGAKVTLHDAAVALLCFVLGCKISGAVLCHLLSLLNLLLPIDHTLFKSMFKFYKYFECIKSPINFIYFCSICCQSLASKDALCTNCQAETKLGFYIHIPLVDQLKRLYARPGFTKLLGHRHNRKKKNLENYEDIYDGEIYKRIEPTLGPLDTTLFWNTDGISLYSSSSFQVWPFYFSVNELPPHLRHKEENMLLGGIAFGYEKPHPNLLLKPMFEELNTLKSKGINVNIPGSNSPVNVKCNVLGGSCDAPARSVFMRMTQFNGHHGCHLCLAKGEKSDRTGQVFVYPAENVLQPRTEEQYKHDVLEHEHGIKGPTYLFYMLWSFFLSSTAVDVMHCVYLGICKQLFSLWFSSENVKSVFGENVEKAPLLANLSKMFCSFNPPHYFNRPPRDLKHVSYFKASEFRIWLFSTALPVFEKYMKEPYLSHFKKLVCGISLLNQSSVSNNDINIARQLLKSFVHQWQDLFGLRHMSYNLHCLLHLPDAVSLFGPLFVSSCFAYENINGILARLVHGTRYAGLQIQQNLGLLRNIPALINSIFNSCVITFCKTAMSNHNRLNITEKLDSETFVVGQVQQDHNIDPVFTVILRQAFSNNNYDFFFRLKKSGFLYVCKDYERGSRDSSNVEYNFETNVFYGSLKFFVKVHNQCYAFIQRYTTSYYFSVDEPVKVIIKSILSFSETQQVDIVPVKCLRCVCFKMSVDSRSYLSPPLNFRELE